MPALSMLAQTQSKKELGVEESRVVFTVAFLFLEALCFAILKRLR